MFERKSLGIAVSTLIMLLLIIYMGPMDGFTHGYFVDEIDCEQIASEDYLDSISLETADYEMIFSPQKLHMVGFEIYFINQPEDNTGNVIMTVLTEAGRILDTIVVDLSEVHAATWYKVYTDANLKIGENYILKFSADNCATVPYIQNVDSDYLPDETVTGNVLISYAYAKATFTLQNKIIISMFIIAIWIWVSGLFLEGNRKKYLRVTAICVFMIAVLTWNYMYNSMNDYNDDFSEFQVESETLITSVIYAEQHGEYFRDEREGFGLGRYYDLKGCLSSYGLTYITDDNWLNGYSRKESAIIVDSNIYSKEVAKIGNRISFKNGDIYQITNIEDDGIYLFI